MPIMSLYLKGRFYAMLVIKYLMASFYATGSGVKCIMISTLNALHKGSFYANQVTCN